MALIYNEKSKNSTYFHKIKQIYHVAFPADERRNWADFERIFEENEHFVLLGALHNFNLIGFLSYWDFVTFRYVEHFAVAQEHRNHGAGSDILKQFVEMHNTPCILEVEIPDNQEAARRVRFYERNGFKLWHEIDYTQPPYDPTRHPLPLKLMTRGFATAEEVKNATTLLMSEVYGIKG